MKTENDQSERKKLEKLQSEPVNVEFVGIEGSTNKDLKSKSYTEVFTRAAPGNEDKVDPS